MAAGIADGDHNDFFFLFIHAIYDHVVFDQQLPISFVRICSDPPLRASIRHGIQRKDPAFQRAQKMECRL